MKKLVFVVIFLLSTCCLLQDETHAIGIYDWIPDPTHGGTGFITLDPLGTGATDSDFTSSTVIDFQFTFDNGAPTVNLSDLDLIQVHVAKAGILIYGAFFENTAVFIDFRLVFSAGSADYKTFLDPNITPIPYPQEVNSGEWRLKGFYPETTEPIPEPSTMLLLGTGLVGIAGIAIRRKLKRVTH